MFHNFLVCVSNMNFRELFSVFFWQYYFEYVGAWFWDKVIWIQVYALGFHFKNCFKN